VDPGFDAFSTHKDTCILCGQSDVGSAGEIKHYYNTVGAAPGDAPGLMHPSCTLFQRDGEQGDSRATGMSSAVLPSSHPIIAHRLSFRANLVVLPSAGVLAPASHWTIQV
jgi:hypothetical protein